MSSTEQNISSKIVSWYAENARALPWRETRDPYLIWVSEIILQQTTVQQGLSYYLKFVNKFPDVISLAGADEDEVLNLWSGLGYYSRARNMHFTAKYVVNELKAVFPKDHDQLITLKGIGPYTAAAISSFSQNENHAVVDGNVIRLITRLYGIQEDTSISGTIRKIKKLAEALLSFQEPQLFNQAIMEFGALQCVFKNPICQNCPLKAECKAYSKKLVNRIPFKGKRPKKKSRYFRVYHIIDLDGKTMIEKRTNKDIWKGLYQFPLIEFSPLTKDVPACDLLDSRTYQTRFVKTFKQPLTHQLIHAEIHNIVVDRCVDLPIKTNQLVINSRDLVNYAFPKFIDWYLSDNSIPLF
ncbi:MAG: A/G-specific adenine glycosylase [Bacteroidia bacterium]|nr:A/G-specific adenine glycosylase [Bacteroidia bacterium]